MFRAWLLVILSVSIYIPKALAVECSGVSGGKSDLFEQLSISIPAPLNPISWTGDDWYHRVHSDALMALQEKAEFDTLDEVPVQFLFYIDPRFPVNDSTFEAFTEGRDPKPSQTELMILKAESSLLKLVEANPHLEAVVEASSCVVVDEKFVSAHSKFFSPEGASALGENDNWAPVQLIKRHQSSGAIFVFNQPIEHERERIREILGRLGEDESYSAPPPLDRVIFNRWNEEVVSSFGKESARDFVNRAVGEILQQPPVTMQNMFSKALGFVFSETSPAVDKRELELLSSWIQSGSRVYLILQFLHSVKSLGAASPLKKQFDQLFKSEEISEIAEALVKANLYVDIGWISNGMGPELVIRNYSSDRTQVQSRLSLGNRFGADRVVKFPLEITNGDAEDIQGDLKREALLYSELFEGFDESCFFDLVYDPIEFTNITSDRENPSQSCWFSRALRKRIVYTGDYFSTSVYSADVYRELRAASTWFFLATSIAEELMTKVEDVERRVLSKADESVNFNSSAQMHSPTSSELSAGEAGLVEALQTGASVPGLSFAGIKMDWLQQPWMADRALHGLIDLESFSLEELLNVYEDKVVVIQIGAPWCAPCFRATDVLSNILAKEYSKGLRVIDLQLIAWSEPQRQQERDSLARALERKPSSIPYVILSEEAQVALQLQDADGSMKFSKLRALPEFIFLDRNHDVVGVSQGVTESYIRELLEK